MTLFLDFFEFALIKLGNEQLAEDQQKFVKDQEINQIFRELLSSWLINTWLILNHEAESLGSLSDQGQQKFLEVLTLEIALILWFLRIVYSIEGKNEAFLLLQVDLNIHWLSLRVAPQNSNQTLKDE